MHSNHVSPIIVANVIALPAINDYNPRIIALVDELSRCIGTFGKNPVDIDQVMSWFSWDVMGEVLFGEDFGLMKNMVTHPSIKHRDRALALAGPLGDAIWIALLGFQLLPPVGRINDWRRMLQFCEDHMRSRIKVGAHCATIVSFRLTIFPIQRGSNGKSDMATYFIEEYENTAKTKSKKARDLHLSGTAVTAVVAGRLVSSFILFMYYVM